MSRRTSSLKLAGPLDTKSSSLKTHASSLIWLDLENAEYRYLLAASADGLIAIYDTSQNNNTTQALVASKHVSASQQPQGARQSHRPVGASCALFYAVDSGMFVTSSYDDCVRFWDTNAMESVLAMPFFEKVYHLAVPRTNTWTKAGAPHALTAAAVADGSVALCDPVSGSAAHTLAGVHRGAVMCCAWSTANANQIASGGSDGVVAVWDIRRSASALVQLTAETESAHAVAVRAAAAAAVEENAWEEHAAAWRELEQAQAAHNTTNAAAPTTTTAARREQQRPAKRARGAANNNLSNINNDDTSVPRPSFTGSVGDIRMPQPLPRASLVRSGGRSARAVGLPTADGASAHAAQRRTRMRRAAVGGGFSASARHAAAPLPGLSDGRAFQGGGSSRRVTAHDTSVIAVHASACGETWLALAADGCLRAFDHNTGRRHTTTYAPLVGTIAQQQHRPCAWTTDASAYAMHDECAFVPLGRRGVVQVHIATGTIRAEFKAHFGGGATCAVMDPHSTALYTGGMDRNIFRWRPSDDCVDGDASDVEDELSSSDEDAWSDDDYPL